MNMKCKVRLSETITQGMNNKNEKPHISDNVMIYSTNNRFLPNNERHLLSEYDDCTILDIEWYKWKLYAKIKTKANDYNVVFCCPFQSVIVWLKKFGLTPIMAWIGGVLSIIFTITQLLN